MRSKTGLLTRTNAQTSVDFCGTVSANQELQIRRGKFPCSRSRSTKGLCGQFHLSLLSDGRVELGKPVRLWNRALLSGQFAKVCHRERLAAFVLALGCRDLGEIIQRKTAQVLTAQFLNQRVVLVF